MKAPVLILCCIVCVCGLSGCVQYKNKRGVEVTWQSAVTSQLEKGQSTRKDVLSLLGPPSQVISLEEETVLYYLFEHSKGSGLILIVYNRMKINTRYDRAIFFFDESDLLTDYATHINESQDS